MVLLISTMKLPRLKSTPIKLGNRNEKLIQCIIICVFLYCRLTWIVVIIAFFSYGFYTIYGLITQWDENAHETTIKNFSADVSQIQFPTVTICPKGWPNDRWGFIRGYLNEYDLKNPKFQANINKQWKFYLDQYYDVFEKALRISGAKGDIIIQGMDI